MQGSVWRQRDLSESDLRAVRAIGENFNGRLLVARVQERNRDVKKGVVGAALDGLPKYRIADHARWQRCINPALASAAGVGGSFKDHRCSQIPIDRLRRDASDSEECHAERDAAIVNEVHREAHDCICSV